MTPLRVISVLVVLILTASQCPSGSQCTACTDSQCKTCDTAVGTCDACNTGYYLDATPACTACPDKCLTCATNTYCDKCTPGYDREYDSEGNQICKFYWWKWFLIVFGVLFGVVILGGLIWWIRNKLKEEDNVKEVNYQIKAKHQNTEQDLKA